MSTAVFIFSHNLRLGDNPLLYQALTQHDGVILLWWDDTSSPYAAAQTYGRKSFVALRESIHSQGGKLHYWAGDCFHLCNRLAEVAQLWPLAHIYYESPLGQVFAQQALDLQDWAQNHQIPMSLAWQTTAIAEQHLLNKTGKPYGVFTPFYRHYSQLWHLLPPPSASVDGLLLSKTHLDIPQDTLPSTTPWQDKIMAHWQPGEHQAWCKFNAFCSHIEAYADQRDFPALQGTSQLSPALAWGEITMNAMHHHLMDLGLGLGSLAEPWRRQLVWREFAKNLLWRQVDLETHAYQKNYEHLDWQDNPTALQAWQRGETGFPIIDAAMQQLWQTGWMHNRTRMLVASFLTKNLGIHWLAGQAWFDYTLVDLDVANNVMGWQWVAGCGVDAAPYYRLFNPILQSEKFDPEGQYIQRYLPQLSKLSPPAIYQPWEYPLELGDRGLVFGQDYPSPLVDLAQSREALSVKLAQLKTLKQNAP